MLADTTERIDTLVLLERVICALLALHDNSEVIYHRRVCSDLENCEAGLARLIMPLIDTPLQCVENGVHMQIHAGRPPVHALV